MEAYRRIANTIAYIQEHSEDQPGLEEIARAVHLSPFHFNRLFIEWAGITPKEFLRYVSLNHAKQLLETNPSLEEASFQTGLSSSSRLHDLFVKIEGMTPAEFRNNGRNLQINYAFSESPFGEIVIAATSKGICNLQFVTSRSKGLQALKKLWPDASLTEMKTSHIASVRSFFSGNWNDIDRVKLHLRGTKFQIKVWEALLGIPAGGLTTYSRIANVIGNPKASRAVGTAVGSNPVAYLIPCHRVIKKMGGFGEYRWGGIRKTAIIGWEAACLRDEEIFQTEE